MDLYDLIVDVAARAVAVADAALRGLYDLYAAGASNGMDPGPLAAGAAAAGAAGTAAAAGGGTSRGGGTGSSVPPWPSAGTVNDHRAGRSRFRDSAGNGYWPGISPIPGDGVVHRVVPRHPNLGGDYTQHLPVSPVTGAPIFPRGTQTATERPVAALTNAGRG